MMLSSSLRDRIQPWLRDYVRLQSLAFFLIYLQIGCALIGSLGSLYNGVLLINLAIALFALVAIESNSQSLGRTYAVFLFCAILLDISSFILFTQELWLLLLGISRESSLELGVLLEHMGLPYDIRQALMVMVTIA